MSECLRTVDGTPPTTLLSVPGQAINVRSLLLLLLVHFMEASASNTVAYIILFHRY